MHCGAPGCQWACGVCWKGGKRIEPMFGQSAIAPCPRFRALYILPCQCPRWCTTLPCPLPTEMQCTNTLTVPTAVNYNTARWEPMQCYTSHWYALPCLNPTVVLQHNVHNYKQCLCNPVPTVHCGAIHCHCHPTAIFEIGFHCQRLRQSWNLLWWWYCCLHHPLADEERGGGFPYKADV